jgi:hypothetical protein
MSTEEIKKALLGRIKKLESQRGKTMPTLTDEEWDAQMAKIDGKIDAYVDIITMLS